MSNDERLDGLLDDALLPGAPAAGTPAQQEEIKQLRDIAGLLRAASRDAAGEAQRAQPVARARFERFVQAAEEARRSAPREPVARPPAPRSGGVFGLRRGVLTAGSAAAIGVIAVVAVFLTQATVSDVTPASALSPGDYVQVEGVVASATGSGAAQTVHLTSELDDLTVAITETTSVLAPLSAGTEALQPGESVLVGGVVADDLSISATTVAKSERKGGPVKPIRLRTLDRPLAGRVVTLTVARDGSGGRLILDDGKGHRYLVPITARAAEVLLSHAATALGTNVTVTRDARPNGPFSVEIARPQRTAASATPASPRSRSPGGASVSADGGFAGVMGVVVARDGNVLRVDTPRGQLAVVIRATTRILLGESGLIREEVLTGKVSAIGHRVSVSGGLDAATRRVIADVVVIGPKAPTK